MGFVAPLLFAGLVAVAIPIFIHLIQRERKRVVEFPSLMFLRRIPYQSVRRRRIRHWPLLLLRLAAIALIVTAFARPFLRLWTPAATATGAREVAIVVDRSYSMEYGDRWDRARAAARDAVNHLRPGERASLVFFDTGAEVALRSTADRSRLLSAIDAARTSAAATKFAPALKLAGSLLAESPLARREAILISDYQRGGWGSSEDVRLPDRAVFTPVDVGSVEMKNVAVTPVSLQRTRFENQERIAVTAGVINRGGAPIARLPIALELDGKVVDTEPVDVAANGSGSVTFAPFTVSARNMRAAVRIPDDSLRRDNVFDFVVSPIDPLKVTVLERPALSRVEGEGAAGESLYLTRALAIGESPRVDATLKSIDAFTDADARASGVVILNDVPVTASAAERLGRFVAAGGGLFAIAGPRADWPEKGADVLPALPAGTVDRASGTSARLGALEYGHPIFDVFRAPRSGDFSAAQFYGYRAIRGAPSQVIARFDDGAPALVERKGQAGRVLMWTSTVDLSWNDLALKPVFLPFVHTLVRYLADYREPAASLTVGQIYVAPRLAGSRRGAPQSTRIVLAPSGRRVDLGGEDQDVLELTEQGFYDIRPQTGGSEWSTTVASNVDLKESDPARIDPKELATAITGRPGGGPADFTGHAPTAEEQARAQRIWWYLLAAGLALLGVEAVLANRLSGSRIA